MKTNAILKISSGQIGTKNKNLPKKQSSSPIQNINQTINELWEMYQNQLQRNLELMKVIQHQQQYIQSFAGNHPQFISNPESSVQVIEPVKKPGTELSIPSFKDLSMQQVNKYTAYFQAIFGNKVRRLDAIHNVIRLLHTLHQLGGSAYREVLIEKTELVASTACRHISFLHRQGLITDRSQLDHKYSLTNRGKLFLMGKLEKSGYMSETDKKSIPTEPLID